MKVRGRRIKIKKAAFCLSQILRWFENNEELKKKTRVDLMSGVGLVYGAMIQFNTQKGHRRSEYTDGGEGFDPDWDLSRDHVKYFWESDGKMVELQDRSAPSLEEWLATAGLGTSEMKSRPPLMKNDQCGVIYGDKWTPLPLTEDKLCGAAWVARMESKDPVTDEEERKNTPLFRHPKTKKMIRTHIFDEVVMEIVYYDLLERGAHVSMAQVRKMYSLHSFRVTATNLLLAAKAPRHIRKMLGRWSSDSGMDAYTREEEAQMSHFMRLQSKQISAAFQMLDMPAGVLTAGGIKGVSRGRKLDAIEYGEVEIETATILTGEGILLEKLDRKDRKNPKTTIDLEGDIVEEPGEGLIALARESGQNQTNEDVDEVHGEEEWTPEPFRIPEGTKVMPKPENLAGNIKNKMIIKHFGDFGWAIGRIQKYSARNKLPFQIRWEGEEGVRLHKLIPEEHIEEGDVREAKAGDFMILEKEG